MTSEVKRLTPQHSTPAFLILDKGAELASAIAEVATLRAENAALRAKLAALEGPDWSRRDSVTY